MQKESKNDEHCGSKGQITLDEQHAYIKAKKLVSASNRTCEHYHTLVDETRHELYACRERLQALAFRRKQAASQAEDAAQQGLAARYGHITDQLTGLDANLAYQEQQRNFLAHRLTALEKLLAAAMFDDRKLMGTKYFVGKMEADFEQRKLTQKDCYVQREKKLADVYQDKVRRQDVGDGRFMQSLHAREKTLLKQAFKTSQRMEPIINKTVTTLHQQQLLEQSEAQKQRHRRSEAVKQLARQLEYSREMIRIHSQGRRRKVDAPADQKDTLKADTLKAVLDRRRQALASAEQRRVELAVQQQSNREKIVAKLVKEERRRPRPAAPIPPPRAKKRAQLPARPETPQPPPRNSVATFERAKSAEQAEVHQIESATPEWTEGPEPEESERTEEHKDPEELEEPRETEELEQLEDSGTPKEEKGHTESSGSASNTEVSSLGRVEREWQLRRPDMPLAQPPASSQPCPFSWKPDVIEFRDFQVGVTYRRRVSIVNLSATRSCCRYIGVFEAGYYASPHPLSEMLRVHFCPPGFVGTGLSARLELEFTPSLLVDGQCLVRLQAPNGEFHVPVRFVAQRCLPRLERDQLQFGEMVIGTRLKRGVLLRNDGTKGCRFTVRPPAESGGGDSSRSGDGSESESDAPEFGQAKDRTTVTTGTADHTLSKEDESGHKEEAPEVPGPLMIDQEEVIGTGNDNNQPLMPFPSSTGKPDAETKRAAKSREESFAPEEEVNKAARVSKRKTAKVADSESEAGDEEIVTEEDEEAAAVAAALRAEREAAAAAAEAARLEAEAAAAALRAEAEAVTGEILQNLITIMPVIDFDGGMDVCGRREGELPAGGRARLCLGCVADLEGSWRRQFVIEFDDPACEPLTLTTSYTGYVFPVSVRNPHISFGICICDLSYWDSFEFFNTGKVASRVQTFIPDAMKPYVEIQGATTLVQAESSFYVKLLFKPKRSLLTAPPRFFDPSLHVLDFPVSFRVAGRTLSGSVQAAVCSSRVLLTPAKLEFGRVTLRESCSRRVQLTNKALIAQRYQFTSLPDSVSIQPGDGGGYLLPGETAPVDVIFSPSVAGHQQFTIVVETLDGGRATVSCRAQASSPALFLSSTSVKMTGVPIDGEMKAAVYVQCPKVSLLEEKYFSMGGSFEFQPPEDVPIRLHPLVGFVPYKGSRRVEIVALPRLREDEVRVTASLLRYEQLQQEDAERLQRQAEQQGTKKKGRKQSPPKKPQFILCPEPSAIPAGSEALRQAQVLLRSTIQPATSRYLIPCCVRHGHMERPASGAGDVLYLELICTVVPADVVTAAPRCLQFGPRALDAPAYIDVTLESANDTPVPLRADPLPPHGPFALVRALRTLEPGRPHTARLCYRPERLGPELEFWTVHGGNVTHRFGLSGSGAEPKYTIAPADGVLAMGKAKLGKTTKKQIVVANVGEAPLEFDVELNTPSDELDPSSAAPGSVKRRASRAAGKGAKQDTAMQPELPLWGVSASQLTVPPHSSAALEVVFNPVEDGAFEAQVVLKLFHWLDKVCVNLVGRTAGYKPPKPETKKGDKSKPDKKSKEKKGGKQRK